jgi:hypothetical protein
MELALEKDKIVAVFVFFRSKDVTPFAGTIEGGITGDTSIDDAIKKLGQPTYIFIRDGSRFDDWPDAKYTELNYLEGGLVLQFVDGKLTQVDVRPPKFDYEREIMKDVGDTRRYREIVPQKQIGKKPEALKSNGR